MLGTPGRTDYPPCLVCRAGGTWLLEARTCTCHPSMYACSQLIHPSAHRLDPRRPHVGRSYSPARVRGSTCRRRSPAERLAPAAHIRAERTRRTKIRCRRSRHTKWVPNSRSTKTVESTARAKASGWSSQRCTHRQRVAIRTSRSTFLGVKPTRMPSPSISRPKPQKRGAQTQGVSASMRTSLRITEWQCSKRCRSRRGPI